MVAVYDDACKVTRGAIGTVAYNDGVCAVTHSDASTYMVEEEYKVS